MERDSTNPFAPLETNTPEYSGNAYCTRCARNLTQHGESLCADCKELERLGEKKEGRLRRTSKKRIIWDKDFLLSILNECLEKGSASTEHRSEHEAKLFRFAIYHLARKEKIRNQITAYVEDNFLRLEKRNIEVKVVKEWKKEANLEEDVQFLVRRMTNHQRNLWAQEHYPGLRPSDPQKVKRFLLLPERES